MENWNPMPSDFRYEVSDLGFVRRAETQRVRKPSKTPTGYHVIVLSRPGQKHLGVYVHREIMAAFVGPCPPGCQVSHLNGDNSDNRLANLCYESSKENILRKQAHKTQTFGESHAAAKITFEQVKQIKAARQGGKTLAAIANEYGLCHQHVSRICKGINWNHPSLSC
jgi:hypothetical protein